MAGFREPQNDCRAASSLELLEDCRIIKSSVYRRGGDKVEEDVKHRRELVFAKKCRRQQVWS